MDDMQGEIIARLANALDAELIAAEALRAEHSVNPDVMDLYFQGKRMDGEVASTRGRPGARSR
ncbi:hypothetical protein ACNJX9_06670 [Bradyrhizobium sp. DASA03076]|uniref:hypothetical protein n=1 Tax=Bradyrhizobium sp. BLXBL-03 TaxID=3395916 RepID=UPI003F7021B1